MAEARGLRWRIASGLFAYCVLLGAALLYAGYLTNEKIEHVVWRSLLDAEANRFLAHLRSDPRYPLPRGGTLHAYLVTRTERGDLPAGLDQLGPGFHNDVPLAGHEASALVRALPDGRWLVLAVDADLVERNEKRLLGWSLLGALLGVGVLLAAVQGLTSRLLRPITRLIRGIDSLRPERTGSRLIVADDAPKEVAIISDSVNRHLERIEGFIDREREFIDMMSHELRTPLAALRGAVDVLEARPASPPEVARVAARMRETLVGSEQLVETLLLLAREPTRIRQHAEVFDLRAMVADIVEAHASLARDRGISVELESGAPLAVTAAPRAVEIAVANLLRNAIEHGAGSVRVRAAPDAVIEIAARAAATTPREVARLYSAAARDGRTRQSGIGLALIARLCQHMHWRLDIAPGADGATVTRLHAG